jgi:hypothetical protein
MTILFVFYDSASTILRERIDCQGQRITLLRDVIFMEIYTHRYIAFM